MLFEENMEFVGVRIFPSMLAQIELIIKADTSNLFENRSHFIRCSVNHFMRSKHIKELIKANKLEE